MRRGCGRATTETWWTHALSFTGERAAGSSTFNVETFNLHGWLHRTLCPSPKLPQPSLSSSSASLQSLAYRPLATIVASCESEVPSVAMHLLCILFCLHAPGRTRDLP